MATKTQKPAPIVTKQSLAQMIEQGPAERVMHIVGRALCALLDRQTEAERNADATTNHNGVGFASADARTGSLVAKSYLARKHLQPWQVAQWTRISGTTGLPRICKYARQLNEIAEEKAAIAQGQKNAALMVRPEYQRMVQLQIEYGESVDSDDPAILTPIVRELRALEQQLEVPPFIIGGAVV